MVRLCWITILLFVIAEGSPSIYGQQSSLDETVWKAEPFSVPADTLHQLVQNLEVPEDADIEILLDDTQVQFEADGRSTSRIHQVYRVITESGVDEYGSSAIAWSPWFQNRPVLKARVIDKDGQARDLQEGEISEAPVQRGENLYSDQRQLQAPLPAIEVGSIVETLTIVEDSRPMFKGGTGSSQLFHCVHPIRMSRLQVSVPVELPFQFKAYGEKLNHSDETLNGRRILKWQCDRQITFDDFESNVPPDQTQGTQVYYSTGQSWADVSTAYQELIQSQLADESLKSTADMVVAGETDRNKKIEKLLAWVQGQVRYTGLLFGDGSIVPAPPTDVIRRRYGDCKDQSILLTGLLRAAGIDAWPVLLRSAQGWDVSKDMPTISFFNHMIVFVPGAPDLWIDPAAPHFPIGELPLGDQGRLTLIIRPGTADLVQSPMMSAASSAIRIERDVRLSELGGTQVDEKNIYTGTLAQDVRSYGISSGDKELRSWIREIATGRHGTDKIDGLRVSALRDLSVPVEFSYTTRSSDLASFNIFGGNVLAGAAILMSTLPHEVKDLRPYLTPDDQAKIKSNPEGDAEQQLSVEKQRRRKLPLRVNHPNSMDYVCRVHIPAGFHVEEMPKPFALRRGEAYLTGDFELNADRSVWTATCSASSGNLPLTTEDIEWWQSELRKLFPGGLEENWEVSIRVLHPTEGKLSDDAHDAIRLLLDRRREAPADAANNLRLAAAMNYAGLNEAGRELADSVVQSSPNSTQALFVAATLYGEGVSGCAQTRAERARQRELLQKAVALDASDTESHFALARVLQADENYLLNSEADLKEAIRLLTLHEEKMSTEPLRMLLQCYFYTGQFKEVVKRTEHLQSEHVWLGMNFAAQVQIDGFKSAYAKLKNQHNESDQVEILLVAYELTNSIRDFPSSVEVLAAASRLAPDRTEFVSLRGVIKQLKKHDSILKPEHDPIGVVQRSVIASVSRRDGFGAPKDLIDGDDETRARILFAISEELLQRDPDSWGATIRLEERVADLISLLKIDKTGSDEAGFRAKAKFGGEATFYLAKRDGRLKILGLSTDVKPVADAILRLVDSNQLVEARQMLDWIADEQSAELSIFKIMTGPILPHLWKKSSSKDATSDRVKLAALSIASPEVIGRNIDFMLQQREGLRQSEQLQLDRLLTYGCLLAGRNDQLLEVSERICSTRLGASELWHYKAEALRNLQRYDEADTFTREFFKDTPDNPRALESIARTAAARGEKDRAARMFERIASMTGATPNDFNMAAWSAVFNNPVDDKALENARTAVRLTVESSHASLHTLATILAERGETQEAISVLEKSIAVKRPKRLEASDQYVIGRVAEHLGLSDVARSCYQKVLDVPKRNGDDFSVQELAEKRTAVLDGRK